jgi:hypothetical protein
MTQSPFSGPGLAQQGRPRPPWQPAGSPPTDNAPRDVRRGEPEVTHAVPTFTQAAATQAAATQATATQATQPRAAAPASRRHAPRGRGTGVLYWFMLSWTVASMGLVWSSPQNVRWGADMFGAGLLLSAAARIAFPARSAGMLATRRRWTDAATIAAFGIGTLAIGLVLPPPS